MSLGLNESQIIRLHRELIAPLAVHEIVRGYDCLDETARYTLDVMITEFQPDTALLCIALCAAHIAETHATSLPIAATLGLEASRIVHEMGPFWLAHADGRLAREHEIHVIDLLEQMPEDFEAMADLLLALRAHLNETSDSAILCEILALNAQAFIDYLDEQSKEEQMLTQRSMLDNLEVRGNVITFPRNHRQH